MISLVASVHVTCSFFSYIQIRPVEGIITGKMASGTFLGETQESLTDVECKN